MNIAPTPRSRVIYKLTVVQIARNAAPLIETNSSLPSTQQKADGPSLQPHESSPRSSVLFRIHFTVTSTSPLRLRPTKTLHTSVINLLLQNTYTWSGGLQTVWMSLSRLLCKHFFFPLKAKKKIKSFYQYIVCSKFSLKFLMGVISVNKNNNNSHKYVSFWTMSFKLHWYQIILISIKWKSKYATAHAPALRQSVIRMTQNRLVSQLLWLTLPMTQRLNTF